MKMLKKKLEQEDVARINQKSIRSALRDLAQSEVLQHSEKYLEIFTDLHSQLSRYYSR